MAIPLLIQLKWQKTSKKIFMSIGKNLQIKIPPTKKTFTDYLKSPNLENFTRCLTSADEISDLIAHLIPANT